MILEESPIGFHVADVAFEWSSTQDISRWLCQVFRAEGCTLKQVHLIACSDDYLLQMNRQHLDHDYYTDILTFYYSEDAIDGELYISIERVKDNAHQLDIPELNELHRVIVHGALHLCGHDDQTREEKQKMRDLEELYLGQLTLSNPGA
ncbi:MAG: rRNA maturation RNase YbeY [Bacteroidota bacterium]